MALAACQKTNQEKAKDLISTFQKANPDINKIEYGTLQKAQLDYELTMSAYELREEMRKSVEIMKEKQEFINQWKDIRPSGLADDMAEIQKSAKYIKQLNDSFELEKKRFRPDTTRYMMEVRLHHINPKTNKEEIVNGTFFFDKEVSRIVGSLGPIGDNDNTPVYIELSDIMKSKQ